MVSYTLRRRSPEMRLLFWFEVHRSSPFGNTADVIFTLAFVSFIPFPSPQLRRPWETLPDNSSKLSYSLLLLTVQLKKQA